MSGIARRRVLERKKKGVFLADSEVRHREHMTARIPFAPRSRDSRRAGLGVQKRPSAIKIM